MNKLLSIAAPLPLFSASTGHTYIQQAHTVSDASQTALAQQSKENTPMPDNLPTAPPQPTKSAPISNLTAYEDTQNFLDAMNLSRRFGNEYMDESLLVGEPGNFRTSKVKEVAALSRKMSASEGQLSVPANEKNPAISPPPPIQTDIPHPGPKKSAKGGDRSPSTPGGREKPKRRKSRPAVTPTDS